MILVKIYLMVWVLALIVTMCRRGSCPRCSAWAACPDCAAMFKKGGKA